MSRRGVSNAAMFALVIFGVATIGVNAYLMLQTSQIRDSIQMESEFRNRVSPSDYNLGIGIYRPTSWQPSADNPPHCWYYEFLAPIGTLCYQAAPKQPYYGMSFVMDSDYYALVSAYHAIPPPQQVGSFPPLQGNFPLGSLQSQTITKSKSTATVEGKVAGLVLKDGQLLLTFEELTTNGIPSITIDASKVNLSEVHVGSIVRASITTTTTAYVYTAMIPFTLSSINDNQASCYWMTPLGSVQQNQAYQPPSVACTRFVSVGNTIPVGSTFWTISEKTTTSIDSFEVVSP